MKNERRIIVYDQGLEVEAYQFEGVMQSFPNHFHEYYVIGFIESGLRSLTLNHVKHRVESGDLLLFNPGDKHACMAIDDVPLDYRCLNIKVSVMRRLTKEICTYASEPYFHQTVIHGDDKVNLLRDIHQMIMNKSCGLEKEEVFFWLIEHLIDNYASLTCKINDCGDNDAVEKICCWLEKNYAEDVSLKDLSTMIGWNKYTLLRTFTRLKGITPYRYLITVRVGKAKEMLEKGVEPIECGLSTGFADQSHFTTTFKDLIGLTPKQYQKIFKSRE